jgi:hypothetical protein
MVLAYLPLLYSNAVLKGESRKFLRLVVNGKSCDECAGGEGGIRTLGTGVSPYNGLANRRIRPLCHLSGVRSYSLPRDSRMALPLQS